MEAKTSDLMWVLYSGPILGLKESKLDKIKAWILLFRSEEDKTT